MEDTDDDTYRQDAVPPHNLEAQRVRVSGQGLASLGVDGVDAAAVARRGATARGGDTTLAGRRRPVVFRPAVGGGNHYARSGPRLRDLLCLRRSHPRPRTGL